MFWLWEYLRLRNLKVSASGLHLSRCRPEAETEEQATNKSDRSLNSWSKRCFSNLLSYKIFVGLSYIMEEFVVVLWLYKYIVLETYLMSVWSYTFLSVCSSSSTIKYLIEIYNFWFCSSNIEFELDQIYPKESTSGAKKCNNR